MDVRRGRRLLAVLVASSLVAACTDEDPESTATTVAATTTTVPAVVETDGRLIIGALIPSDNAAIGTPLRDAINAAVDAINQAGGALDRPVRVIVADEADPTAIQSLIDAGVDAVIGPSSSLVALASLDEIVSAGKVACSSTASALALDDFPDDDLFFRTIPSDSLQAVAIAQAADQTGAQRAAILYIDDVYGRGLADAVQRALTGGAVTMVESIPIAPDDSDLSDAVAQIAEAQAQVAVVLADAEDGPQILAAMDETDTAGLATVVVNDAMRSPATPQTIADLSPEFRQKIVGVAPQAQAEGGADPFDPPGPFATNAFDCVTLIALAAVRAGSDVPRDIAAEIAEVSASGSLCRSFEECVDELESELQIDYNGPSGLTELSSTTGDPERAIFDRFRFDETGSSVFERTVPVSS